MSALREAAQQALEALEYRDGDGADQWKADVITALRAALAQEQAEPVVGIIESKIKGDSHQTLDDAMQQPRAMAQAYESGYKAGVANEREAIMDEWSVCVQSDLENGVRWLNEQAAKKWQKSYPAMAGFADKIYAREK